MGSVSPEQYLQELLQLSKEQLVSRLVHDLRNRVNGILVAVDLLSAHRDEFSPEEEQQYLDYIDEYARDILDIVNVSLDCYDHHQQGKEESGEDSPTAL
jgi:signal transduction histidine kinase